MIAISRKPPEGLRLFGTTMARKNLGRVRIADWIGKGGDYPTNEETAGHHDMGGTRMVPAGWASTSGR
ncbi:MAG: hypothetical protein EOQ55_21795 [Mesorhizobium sp.]|nr:hypothetical protein EOD29_19195 [Mesorhizobium sp. M1A.T.Ca.IN.004.03.1.1]RWG15883.1 MAG: hypothetical protein EOQ55_21795 [Mesorhizobium sp.]RWI95394.1 MAG: hypothetical protein EOR21_11990 [Mesorhizobium sp.]RWK37185.1 MAG: hypothetical protein EOR40_12235 [Mesorhizobium sp.]RWK86294.1 MAG: hypothetical protein EOR52_23210 [Mesorhizobium sp.]